MDCLHSKCILLNVNVNGPIEFVNIYGLALN